MRGGWFLADVDLGDALAPVGCWAELWRDPGTDGGVVMLMNGVAVDDPSYLEKVAMSDRRWQESLPTR